MLTTLKIVAFYKLSCIKRKRVFTVDKLVSDISCGLPTMDPFIARQKNSMHVTTTNLSSRIEVEAISTGNLESSEVKSGKNELT